MQVDHVNAKGNAVPPAKAQASPAADQTNAATDSVSKDIQSKIVNAQKQRQGLSFNMEMTAEEKENIRQKIQQEISDLKRELRQREAEEKKKQQEAQRALEKKEEQQEKESQEAVREQQQKIQPAQDDGRQQQKVKSSQDENRQPENTSVSENNRPADVSAADGEVREILPGGMHKILSTNSSVTQFRIVRNSAAQNEKAARIQEAEINQDAVRGTETDDLKKDQLKSIQKETQRMETVQKFIFGNSNNRSVSSAIGSGTNFSNSAKENGLYNSNGTMFQNYIQSIQMDVRQ